MNKTNKKNNEYFTKIKNNWMHVEELGESYI